VKAVASLSQGHTAAAQCGLFTHKSLPVIFEPPCILRINCAPNWLYLQDYTGMHGQQNIKFQ